MLDSLRGMEQVARNVYRLGSRSHNFYLLTDQGEATLIDAGCSREWSYLVDALASLDMSPESVSAILATHAHADHLGFGAEAQKEGLEIKVHVDEETRALGTYTGRFAVKPFELPIFRVTTWRNFIPMIRAGVMKHHHLDTVGTFSDGDTLDVPGRPQAIHTPGHTEGHTMFHTDRILFTGDGLVTMDLIGTDVGPQMINPIFNLDTATAYESLSRLDTLDADLLLPGHGPPLHESAPSAAAQVLAGRV